MIGAQALVGTLTGCGVDVCFSNPGTSEMHVVAALDAVPGVRGVLCLLGNRDRGRGRLRADDGPAGGGAAAPGTGPG